MAGNLLLALASFFIGPSQLLQLPNSASLVRMGLFFGGGGCGIIGCFTIAEAINAGVKIYPA